MFNAIKGIPTKATSALRLFAAAYSQRTDSTDGAQ